MLLELLNTIVWGALLVIIAVGIPLGCGLYGIIEDRIKPNPKTRSSK